MTDYYDEQMKLKRETIDNARKEINRIDSKMTDELPPPIYHEDKTEYFNYWNADRLEKVLDAPIPFNSWNEYHISRLHWMDTVEKKWQKEDKINKPNHYHVGTDHETIDVIKCWLTSEEYIGYLKGTAIAYLSRAKLKGAETDDYAKALIYIKWLTEITK